MTIKAERLIPFKDRVFVTDMESGNKVTQGGIIIMDDDKKNEGIRDRWAKVYSVGPDVTDLEPGQWILIKHGRWTPGIKLEGPDGADLKVWLIEYPEAVLCIGEDVPEGAHPRDLATSISHAAPF
ncbi:MAG: hypothetical protein EOP83_01740 [Verrucomicrobiaceae bacterium]|nr:MAG: hypothetical protein EOP83_01740 [Verrucomicrobiaceae bacterium]